MSRFVAVFLIFGFAVLTANGTDSMMEFHADFGNLEKLCKAHAALEKLIELTGRQKKLKDLK